MVTTEELLTGLHQSLRERARIITAQPLQPDGEFVLYWMCMAVRLDENPALDAAVEIGNQLRLPVFVYHALSERYPFASDRHHTFILQGARDVQDAFTATNIAYAFHLERPGHRGPHLRTLAERASIVVTEETPVAPLRGWTRALTRSLTTPVVAIDAACVVPMQLAGKAYERAFEFRRATKTLYEERVERAPLLVAPEVASHVPENLPFQPLDLQVAELSELVAQCEIDHAVGPVPHTVGGFRAGRQRWNRFKEQGLSKYAQLRNNALVDGVSRMSPYLHYGMASPQRIARETAMIGNQGAEKYLDELLIWRELAYVFCFFRSDHGRTSALPAWAIETLAEHEVDHRAELMSWERLARGKTGDPLWDAAQQSLLMHGELHNNVRMTWGKAILNWTPNAKRALAMTIDLNHRYALDGRDPASYGGILWCLGQFDRPFPPARPILGAVRSRSTADHAKRLDLAAYREHTTRPLSRSIPSVGIVGAGISGLMCARTLADHGFPVTVFDKSRGVGGRMATRRTDDGVQFDHGAQYFTARDSRFCRYVDSWIDDGIVGPWQGRIVVLENGAVTAEKSDADRFVAVPKMNAICKHLATDLDIRFQTQVDPIRRQGQQWHFSDSEGSTLGLFDIAVISAPAGQAAELLRDAPALAVSARETVMRKCWAVMLAFSRPLQIDFDGAFVHESPISWIARNSSKPGRVAEPETWVVHGSAEWTDAHWDEAAETVAASLTDAFWSAVGISPQEASCQIAHRWRYALPPEPLSERCLFDAEEKVAACGDWCGGPRVEGAFLSGAAAAGRVMGLLNHAHAQPAKPFGADPEDSVRG